MADQPASERTEKPTPERLRRAREEGQIAQSEEVPSALMVGALVVLLALAGPGLFHWFVAQARQGLGFHYRPNAAGGLLGGALLEATRGGLVAMVPFLVGGVAVSVLSSLLVGGWAFAPKAIKFNPGRMSISNGFRQLFSVRSLMRLAISLAKLALILLLAYIYLSDRLGLCLDLPWTSPWAIFEGTARLSFGLATWCAVGLGGIAAVDLLWQKWKYKRDLRMTRQEVKEEMRQHELSPQVRGRIRARQFELSRRRMLHEVPKADVVIVNPTHFAVALKYEAASMNAPRVVAKGADFLARKIRDIAREHAVPIVQRPELARSLYDTVELGQAIPESLFVAVAEVLAMIYRLRGRRAGKA